MRDSADAQVRRRRNREHLLGRRCHRRKGQAAYTAAKTAARPCRSPTIISNDITHMNSSFENKVALITGAGSGMGLVTARAFAEAGAAVALADVNENAVRSAAEELVAAGHKAIGIRCNVADEAEVAAMVAKTVSTFGRLDAAFNNAGIQSPAVEMADV